MTGRRPGGTHDPTPLEKRPTEHQFPSDVLREVATETGVSADGPLEMSADLQEYLERDDGEYEYTSCHDVGCETARPTSSTEPPTSGSRSRRTSRSRPMTRPRSASFYRTMVASAAADGREKHVREMLDDGNDDGMVPIVVTEVDGDGSGFGLEV